MASLPFEAVITSPRGSLGLSVVGKVGDQPIALRSLGRMRWRRISGEFAGRPIDLRARGWFALKPGGIAGTWGDETLALDFDRHGVRGLVGADSLAIGLAEPVRRFLPVPVFVESGASATEVRFTRVNGLHGADTLIGDVTSAGVALSMIACQLCSY